MCMSPQVQTTQVVQAAQPIAQQSNCNGLMVSGGNNGLVPANVTLRASASDNAGAIQNYRFYFGDGQQQQTNQAEVTHQYTVSGNFIPRVDIQDSQGNWKTSSACETNVTVQAAPIESHKSGCSNLYVTADNNGRVPSTVKFEVTGFDNKGDIQNYRLDFGNGVVKDSNGRTFEQVYNRAGTYEARAYIQDTQGNWITDDTNCRRTFTIGTTRLLTTQPSTGTPTALPVAGAVSGVIGIGLQILKKRYHI